MESRNVPLHLLMVEDSQDDAELMVQALRHSGYAVTYLRVETAAGMRAALENQTWDLITSDHAMPRFSAPAALALAQSLRPELPVIIVSGEISQPLAIELLTAGAGDYIRKDNLAQLPHAVERELREAEARRQRRQAEAALHEAIQFHQEIISGVGEGIIVYDRQFRYLVWNRFMEQLTGLPAEQLLGRSAFDVFPDMRSAGVETLFARVLAGESVTVTDQPFTLPQTGKTGWVSATYSPHRDASGQIIGVIATMRDVTEQKQAEAEVQRLKTFNEDIIQNVAEGIVIQDADGLFTFANPAACRLLGRTQEELLGQHGRIVVPPDQRPRVEAADQRREVGSSDRYELEIVRKDGTRVPILVSGRPRFEGGRFAGSLAVFTNLRERKEAEALVQAQAEQLQAQNEELLAQNEELSAQSEALRAAEVEWRASEEKYRTLIEQSSDGILLVDEQGNVCEWNRAHAELTGLSRDEALGKPYWDILFRFTLPEHRTPERLETFKTAILDALRTETSPLFGRTLDAVIYTARGEARHVQQQVFLVRTIQGSRLGSVTRDVTERKKVEEALRESESRFRAIIEQSSEAIMLIDSQGYIKEWNRASEELSGLRRDQVVDHPYWDVQHQLARPEHQTPERRAYLRGTILEILQTGRSPLLEKPIESVTLTAAGDRRYIQQALFLVKTEHGNQIGSIIHDVTARRVAEAALHESEAKYRALVETTGTGYVIVDADGRVLDANPEYVRLSGHETLAEILGWPVTDWTAPYDLARSVQEIKQCFERGCARNLVIDYVDRQGQSTPVEINATVLTTSEGARIVALCRDITERKRTEAALQESEARYRSLFEDSPICLWEEDFSEVKKRIDALRAGGVSDFGAYFLDHPDEVARCASLVKALGVNRAALELYKAGSPAQLMAELFAPDYKGMTDGSTLDLFRDELTARASGATRHTVEGVHYTLDGAPFYAVVNYAVAPGYEATWAKTFMSIVDITARKQAEETLQELTARMEAEIAERQSAEAEVRRLNRDLEARVTERTAQLEAANQELEAFAFSVSHDLRAPLRIISSYSAILQHDHGPQLSDEAQQCLNVIVHNTQKMEQLIQDLLVFSRLSRQPLNKRPVQPARLAQEALDDLRPEQAGRRLEITLGSLPDCQADPALLKQVFANLLSNALKYTRRREVAQIEIGWRQAGGEGVYFVKDNGAGFNMAHAGRLFGVFQRLHSEAEFEGTGVGLAIVQRIIRRHGGRVWAEAEVGRGATFYFTLAGPGGLAEGQSVRGAGV